MRISNLHLEGITPYSLFGGEWRDFAIEQSQLAFSQAYTSYPNEQEFAIARVMCWFIQFYRRFASNIVYATAYVLPVDFGEVYTIAVSIKGTAYELDEIYKTLNTELR